MPYDVILDPAGDIPLTTTSLGSGTELVLQRAAIRLGTHRGEYVLDTSVGLPFITWMQQRPPDVDGIALALRREIADTPGVSRVVTLTGSFNITTRRLTFTGRVVIDDEEVPVEVDVARSVSVNNIAARLLSPYRRVAVAAGGRVATPGVTP